MQTKCILSAPIFIPIDRKTTIVYRQTPNTMDKSTRKLLHDNYCVTTYIDFKNVCNNLDKSVTNYDPPEELLNTVNLFVSKWLKIHID